MVLFALISCEQDTPPTQVEQYLADRDIPEKLWGIISDQGEVVSTPKFEDIQPFSEGLAAVKIGGFWGFIDTEGDVIIPCQYFSAHPFCKGQAAVRTRDGRFGIIDTSGQVIVTTAFDDIRLSEEYPALVRLGADFYFINPPDTARLWGPYISAQPFMNGVTIIQNNEGYHVMDTTGTFLSSPVDMLYMNEDSRLLPFRKDSKNGFMGLDGQILIPANLEGVQPFWDGLSVVSLMDEQMVIDTSGLVKYSSPHPLMVMGHNWICEKNGSKWDLINLDDKKASVSPVEVHRYYNGYAAIRLEREDTWNYLDVDGDLLLEQDILLGWDFENGYARVFGENGMGLIDSSGQEVIRDHFRDIRNLNRSDLWAFRLF